MLSQMDGTSGAPPSNRDPAPTGAPRRTRRSTTTRQSTIAVEAIDRIRDLIATRQLGPGARLPNETDLAGQLGLSRNSLREAVRALALVHVLDVRQGDGTYVGSLEPALLLESIGKATSMLPDRTLLELFEVRRFLEPPATALAAARCTDEDLAELHEDLDRMSAAPGIEELVEVDTRFHRRVAMAAGNQTLASLLDNVSSRTLRARLWHGVARQQARDSTLTQHRGILEALRARDPELARVAAATHVASSEHWLRWVIAGGKHAAEDVQQSAPPS